MLQRSEAKGGIPFFFYIMLSVAVLRFCEEIVICVAHTFAWKRTCDQSFNVGMMMIVCIITLSDT